MRMGERTRRPKRRPVVPCPNIDAHTECPEDYLSWHHWAEAMDKTHKQERCGDCGLYAIWTPRKP